MTIGRTRERLQVRGKARGIRGARTCNLQSRSGDGKKVDAICTLTERRKITQTGGGKMMKGRSKQA